MKNPLSIAAICIVLAYAIAFPAEAGPSDPAVLGNPATYNAKRNLYLECLGSMAYMSLKHGPIMDGFFNELKGIMSACKFT